tara:strand:- start:2109 stop:2573 length:465 start_codon:yes stop_codon:yes gene_type:complete
VFFLNKYINKLLIISLIIISFYNIFSIFILSFSTQTKGYFGKILKYTPYKYSIFFQKPLLYSKKNIQGSSSYSKKLYYLINTTENKSALDYSYWETKMLHQINDQNINKDFERSFINLTILSKNNENKKKILRVYYLRNIPRFSKEVRDTVLSN